MRTPAAIARLLGRPDAQQPARVLSFPVPPPAVATGPVSMRLHEPPTLRLKVTRGRLGTGNWHWRLIDQHGTWHDSGHAPSQPMALALGLVALEQRVLLRRWDDEKANQ